MNNPVRRIKTFFSRLIARGLAIMLPKGLMMDLRHFDVWEEKGYHVTPIHYAFPIPDTKELSVDVFNRQSELIGIDLREGNQIELLDLFKQKFRGEYERFPRSDTERPYQYYLDQGAFRCVDAEILYCMIRFFKPRQMYEIGSGFSTFLSAQAVLENAKQDDIECNFVAIEPYPNETLRRGIQGLRKLITQKVQDVSLNFFEELNKNDILFIDSSHVLKIGSDVQYEYLEILPRLNRGVVVHIHDIFIPAEYPRQWIFEKKYFWNEQYLLQAFLQFNNSFEILWAGSYMHLKHPDKLSEAFDSYDPKKEWPGSFWMRRT